MRLDTDDVHNLPVAVQAVIEQIRRYPNVQDVEDISCGDHMVLVKSLWSVTLPNRFRQRGISKTGVKQVEEVYWRIPLDYPKSAPSPRLRQDFPTNLPHINPHTSGNLVFPCVAEMGLLDSLHSIGLSAILDATCQWLTNAAADNLHCPVQGWELTRRDDTTGLISVDTHAIRAELEASNRAARFYSYRYCYMTASGESIIGAVDTPCLGTTNNSLKQKHTFIVRDTSIRYAPCVLFQTADGHNIDEYRPESVIDFRSLRAFSRHLGVRDAFDARVKYLLSVSSPQSLLKKDRAPVEEFLVVFAVKRPFPLIGSDSRWELLPYRVQYDKDNQARLSDTVVVRPTYFIERSSPPLLQATSGRTVENLTNIGLLGCGSLGSKIALHLAKSGCYQFELVDKDWFSSHNNARHGLIVSDFDNLYGSKSDLLQREILKLNISAKKIGNNILSMGSDDGFQLAAQTDFIIDATASLPVKYFLAHDCYALPGKLIHTVLYGQSTVGVVAIEGDARSVRIDDFAAFLNTLCIDNSLIQTAMYGNEGSGLKHYGEGCSSVTTTMNDIDISLMSAAMTAKINTHIEHNERTQYGLLHIGVLDKLSLNMTWKSHVFPSTLLIPKDGDFDWDIRVLGEVTQKIEKLSDIDCTVENGGVIAGYVCHLSRTIYVTYLLDAPEGSTQLPDRFTLMTTGLEGVFDEIHKKTNGQITFLGTWHSHTQPTPPSEIDRNTLKKLQSHYDFPVIMLTYTGGRLVRV
jgi:molybdopterin/thiamine biosynthesis adenylyltransferase